MRIAVVAAQEHFVVGLAEYLNCDRSALSRELSRMQHDGLIETWRSSFKLLDKDRLKNV